MEVKWNVTSADQADACMNAVRHYRNGTFDMHDIDTLARAIPDRKQREYFRQQATQRLKERSGAFWREIAKIDAIAAKMESE